MFDENENQDDSQNNDNDSAGNDDSGTNDAESSQDDSSNKDDTDYKVKYEESEKQRTQVSQQLSEVNDTLETIKPHVNWDNVNGTGASDSDSDSDGDQYVSKKEVAQQMAGLQQSIAAQRLRVEFFADNPDLKPYEDLVVVNLQKTNPRQPLAARLKEAGEKTQAFLDTERQKGEEKVTGERKKKAAAGADGLGSAGSTSPKTEDKGEGAKGCIERRKQQLRETRGQKQT